jgi:hypothetical protein
MCVPISMTHQAFPTSHRLQNLNKKETDKRNKEARSGSMRTANSLNRYTTSIQYQYNFMKQKIMREAGL